MKRLLVFALLLACSSKKSDEPVAVADPKKAAAAYEARDWKKCSELWLAVATTTKGESMAGPLYNAACCQAQGGDPAAAFATLDRAIAAGLDDRALLADPDLAPLETDARWAQFSARLQAAAEKAEAAVANPELRGELIALVADYLEIRSTADEPATIIENERKITARMKEIVAKHGWPGRSIVGRDGSDAASTLVQHSTDLVFQKECLEKLELAVTQGEARALAHAYLYDRVAVSSGKPQRWGTQLREDGTPYPIEDDAHVEARRKSIGLPSMAEQAKRRDEPYEPK